MKKSIWARFSDWVNGIAEEYEPCENVLKEEKHTEKDLPRLQEEQKIKLFQRGFYVVAFLVCLTVVSVLLYTIFQMPLFGSADNPAVNEVVTRYVEDGLKETGAVNMVAGMILDYRAFDTFGESSVLFLAVTCVMMLLLRDKNNISPEEDIQEAHERVIEKDSRDLILKNVTSMVMPCIMLFGVYVVLNGHISPGGGFSGGAIMGAGLMIYVTAFGFKSIRRFFTYKTYQRVVLCALLTYALSKCYSFYTGANGIHSIIPLGTPGAILSSGLILVLNICVGFIVTCTMYAFYAVFRKGEV